MVLRTLRGKARDRQRFWLGLPLAAAGATAALGLFRRAGGPTPEMPVWKRVHILEEQLAQIVEFRAPHQCPSPCLA